MSFGKAVLIAWGAWIGTLLVGSVIIFLLDKPEWRTTVGILSILLGFLTFVYIRRYMSRRVREK
jgi:hypothetical protein